ncbi:MFS transporter [Rothia uropygialis]|uniref:MFS transporter n=1 Tax=Kocuria sp. 36 TaxID=1415402 RepID=UPI001930E42C|nr:MFS transporter [Kocuria sp. 36]
MIGIFFSSGIPIPLYNTFRVEDGITDSDLALTTVAYLGVTALSLLVFGRVSNHFGRRPVVIAAVLFAVAGCLVLSQVHSLPVLILGRVLQGLACGTASTAAGAMVIDLAPRTRVQWLPAVITSSAPPFAIPLGALVSGSLVDLGPSPRLLGFTLTAALLLLLGVAVLLCPETVARRPGLMRSLVPRVHVPAGARRALLATGFALLATWSFSGFYQAFAPGLTADYLGTRDALMIAVVFSSIVVLSPLGGSLAGRLRPASAMRLGLIVFVTAVALIIIALHEAAIVPFLLCSACAGIAQGASNSGGMRVVFAHVAPQERAGTLATLYLISYGGAALPGLVAGQLSTALTLPNVGTCYAVLVAAAATAALVISYGRRQEAALGVEGRIGK